MLLRVQVLLSWHPDLSCSASRKRLLACRRRCRLSDTLREEQQRQAIAKSCEGDAIWSGQLSVALGGSEVCEVCSLYAAGVAPKR